MPGRNARRQLHHFWSNIWPEAVRDFSQGGIDLQTSDGPGEIRRSPGDKPIFIGLRRGVINLVLTDHLPLYWDNGRALAGVTALSGGYPVCMIALRSISSSGHLRKPPEVVPVRRTEFRVNWYATCLWLFHDGAAIRESAQVCLDRLRSAVASRNEGARVPALRL